ncbi:hypothetical protein [Streptomyces sp. NPDC089919]|uniref:hypothetical protein n=1 Tax=Streptomyces sp. NPDC089919 TaxID=3155188 RepID=UPI003440B976
MSQAMTDTMQARPAGAEGRGRHRGGAAPAEESAKPVVGRHRRTSGGSTATASASAPAGASLEV